MTGGPLDLKIVGDRLRIVRRCVQGLRRLPAGSPGEFAADFRSPAAAESLLRRAIEALLDTARHLLARAHGLATLEYREVARLAAERSLVQSPELQSRFVEIAGFRNRLTHYYDEITPDELLAILRDRLDDLDHLADELERAAARLART
jgi:uncharacterized protein YutE (UPF0331/DUF86 family)